MNTPTQPQLQPLPVRSAAVPLRTPMAPSPYTHAGQVPSQTASSADTELPQINRPPVRDHVSVRSPHPLFGQYQIEKEIGHGSQGRIFLARRLSDNRMVAIKQLNISSIKAWKEYDLFQREANLLKNINIHGVAKFYDAFECLTNNQPCSYLVQEYIQGSNLQKMINDSHRFNVNDVYDILIQTLTILDKLHHHDPPIIHRDIKPSNLMITPNKHGKFNVTKFNVTIIDFGAVANPQIQSGGSTVAGTFGYMPPEQLTGNPVPASDIYALAAVAVQLFSGISPADLPQKDFRLIFEPELQDKPHELVTLLGQMLDPNVEQRLADIPKIIDYLRDIQIGRTINLEPVDGGNYSSKFNKKLALVRDIGQNDNVRLWQELPYNTPRTIPEYYEKTLIKHTNAVRLMINKSFNENKMQNMMLGTRNFNANIKKFDQNIDFTLDRMIGFVIRLTMYSTILGGVCLVLCFLCALLSDLTAVFILLLFALPLLGFAICITILLLIVIVCIFRLPLNFSRLPVRIFGLSLYIPIAIKQLSIHQNRFGISAEDLITDIKTLLSYGRKSIATIDNVEYLHRTNVKPLFNGYTHFSPYDNKTAYFAGGKPLFKITYRFNPPDDKRTEDIVHTFITQSEPENHYKIGDPLPILYHIEDKDLYDEVTSMPFPLTELDLSEPMEGLIVDSSKRQ